MLHSTAIATTDPVALTLRLAESDQARVGDAYNALSASGIGISQFALGQPSLDEVFLTLTGRPATDDETDQEENAA